MQLVVRGKNMEVGDKLRQFVEGKISRLERVLPSLAEAEVELTSERTRSAGPRYVVQVTLKANGALIRAEQSAPDTYTAVDAVLDKIDRQIVRFKDRRAKGPSNVKMPEFEEESAAAEEEEEGEHEGQLVRVKRFAVKPMHVEEALTQMQLLGHDFYVFFNAETDRVSVVYRRRDGDFGLILPELI